MKMEIDFMAMTTSCLKFLYSGMSVGRCFLLCLLILAIICAFVTLPIEEMLKDFVLWLKHVGPWGPFIMAVAYIPLNILALPASILTLGGGYVFGLKVGFAADSIGSTVGATAAFLVGKTLCRSYVSAKLKEYPQFQIITHAISKSGFKIVLLLRLVPILPFNVMNYVLSVTPISVGSYMLASYIGMMPVTFAFVYLGTTIKDISEIGSPEAALGPAHWWMLGIGLVLTVLSTVLITRVAKDALEKAIEEHEGTLCTEMSSKLSDVGPSPAKCGAFPRPAALSLTSDTEVPYKDRSPGVLVRIEQAFNHISPKD